MINSKYLTSWNNYEKKLLKNKEFQAEAQKLEASYQLAQSVIKKRLELKLSQTELANRAKTSQSAIARLESTRHKPSINFLEKVATALNAHLQISIT